MAKLDALRGEQSNRIKGVATWDSVDGAVSYDLWVEPASGSAPVIRESVTTTSFTPATPLPAGSYRLGIRAVATDGSPGWWSLRGGF